MTQGRDRWAVSQKPKLSRPRFVEIQKFCYHGNYFCSLFLLTSLTVVKSFKAPVPQLTPLHGENCLLPHLECLLCFSLFVFGSQRSRNGALARTTGDCFFSGEVLQYSLPLKCQSKQFSYWIWNAWTHRYLQTNCFLDKEVGKVFAIHLPPSYQSPTQLQDFSLHRGAQKQWAQERTAAREGDTHVSLSCASSPCAH